MEAFDVRYKATSDNLRVYGLHDHPEWVRGYYHMTTAYSRGAPRTASLTNREYNVLDHGAAGIRETRESELGYEGVSGVAGTRKTDATYWLVAGNARESLPG